MCGSDPTPATETNVNEAVLSSSRRPDHQSAPSKAAATPVDNVESLNLKLLLEAEDLLLEGLPQDALELINRVLRNLERHFDACEGRDVSSLQCRPMMRRGERELFVLAWAVSARCMLCGRAYENCIAEIKKYSELREGLSESGEFDDSRFVQLERRLLTNHSSGSTFINQMDILQAALEIYVNSKKRVSTGWAPKVVIDHTEKALIGLSKLDADVLLGLTSLCAELHIIRAQAELELERWDDAKDDAEKALKLDQGLVEARYLLECAENEEW